MLAHHNKQTNSIMGNGVYERVKSYIVSNELPAGKRIMVEPIADRLFVSATPVREALIRLAAERMIDDVPKTGFFVKRLSESEIEGLYHLQQLLLGWSLKVIGNDDRVPGILAPPNLFEELQAAKNTSSQVAMHIKQELFVHISRQCGNDDISFLISNINDRTYYACKRDYEIYGDEKGQLLRLCRTYYQKDFDKLRADLQTYFHEKIDRIPNVLRVVRNDFLKTSA